MAIDFPNAPANGEEFRPAGTDRVYKYNGTSWELVLNTDDIVASEVVYGNANSNLAAVNVQDAIDEVVANANSITASDVAFDNSNSNIAAATVQGALDELAVPAGFVTVHAVATSDITFNTNTQGKLLVFDSVIYQIGSAYDPTTGLFTAPVNGVYALNAATNIKVGSNSTALLQFLQNGTTSIAAARVRNETTTASLVNLSGAIAVNVYLAAGDTVQLNGKAGSAEGVLSGGDSCVTFSLVHEVRA